MPSKSGTVAEAAIGERLRRLAERCRELAEMTAVPEVTRELLGIARELDLEAERAEQA